jgi:predicted nucleic acid-binding protein
MRPTVYIETTIPSYYCDVRSELAADIARTREWWDRERAEYECFVSPIVFEELSGGDYPTKSACVELIRIIPILALEPEILEIAQVYRSLGLMPRSPVADSLHLAFASHYHMDYLLTWNCRHLANARKAERLEEINLKMHLGLPRLVTPQTLRPLEDNI